MSENLGMRAILGVVVLVAVMLLAATFVVDALLGSPAGDWSGIPPLASADEATGFGPDDSAPSTSHARVDAEVAASLQTTDGPLLAFHESDATTAPANVDLEDPETDAPSEPGDEPDGGDPAEPADPGDPGDPGDPNPPTDPPSDPIAAVWIWGVVRTPDGAAVAGVRVHIQGTETSATTGPSGIFALSGLEPSASVRLRADLGGLPWHTVGPPVQAVVLPPTGGLRVDILVEPRGNWRFHSSRRALR